MNVRKREGKMTDSVTAPIKNSVSRRKSGPSQAKEIKNSVGGPKGTKSVKVGNACC